MKPTVVTTDADHIAGHLGNIGLFLWRQDTTEPAVRAAEALVRRLAKQYPQGLGLVQVVEPTATAPSSETRKALADLLIAGRTTIKASSVIYEITGFKGAAMRSVVTTLNLLARPDFPHRVYANTLEALQWQAGLIPAVDDRPWRAPEINEAIEALRTQLHAHAET